jgi:IclR family transcriptional regulator, pca regulon regulatory protein
VLLVRDQGYAAIMMNEQTHYDVTAVAAPVRDGSGTVRAAVNLAIHDPHVTEKSLKRKELPLLLETAAAVSIAIGGQPATISRRQRQ